MEPNRDLDAIRQAVTSSDFTLPGGQLATKQQDTFFEYLRDVRNPLLSMVRMHRMTQLTEDIDKIHIGEPITELAPENDAALFGAKPYFGQPVRLTAVKMRSSWEVTTDIKWQQIAKEKIQAIIMDKMVRRAAVDLEYLAMQGDTTKSDTVPWHLLLKANEGWDKLSDGGHIVPASGAGPSYELFGEAWLKMPAHLQVDPGLRWIWNPALRVKLAQTLQGRNDMAGQNAMRLVIDDPLGIPFIEAGAIPRSKEVTGLAAATVAEMRSSRSGPFYITATKYKLKIDIDNKAAKTLDLSALLPSGVTKGPIHAREIANLLNATLKADTSNYGPDYAQAARDDADGFLYIKGVVTGASGEVDVQDDTNDANAEIGLSETPVTGNNALAGKSKMGTFVLLTNPENLLFGVLDATRVYSRFLEEYDKTRVVMYNWADFAIEELDALVKITDLIL